MPEHIKHTAQTGNESTHTEHTTLSYIHQGGRHAPKPEQARTKPTDKTKPRQNIKHQHTPTHTTQTPTLPKQKQ